MDMTFQQDQRLIEMLLDMQRCSNFGLCKQAKYKPDEGHVPRGFSGATGTLEQVLLVMVFAEPGFPLESERYSGNPTKDLRVLLDASYLRAGTNLFHRNITSFLNEVFPTHLGDLDKHLQRVWLTESRHCSIAEEIGNIDKESRLLCSTKHLARQVRLFPNAIVLLAGSKARQVKHLFNQPVECGAFAPPGCNQIKVREGHRLAAEKCRAHIERMTK